MASAQVKVGDTRESVFDALGEPTGHADSNGMAAYTFDRGRVVMRDGRVVSHDIVSAEEAQSEREERERQREARVEEGRDLRDRMMGDRAFREWSARERLAFWEAFRQRYPEVETGLDHAMADQQVQMEEQQQVREMELRVAEAEKKAELAQKHSQPQAQQAYGSGWPLVFTDTFQPFAGADRFARAKDLRRRFGDDPHRLTTPVRQPAPDPPTARERFMPLQQYGQPPIRPSTHPHPFKRSHKRHDH